MFCFRGETAISKRPNRDRLAALFTGFVTSSYIVGGTSALVSSIFFALTFFKSRDQILKPISKPILEPNFFLFERAIYYGLKFFSVYNI